MDEQFWKNAHKFYCDNANVAVSTGTTGEMFMLALLSGGTAQVAAFTPGHMKRFSQLITFKIAEFEKEFGVIKTEDWTPDMESPLQIKDIGSE